MAEKLREVLELNEAKTLPVVVDVTVTLVEGVEELEREADALAETVAETLLLRDDEGEGEEERVPIDDGELLAVREELGDVEALAERDAIALPVKEPLADNDEL